ncbi:MAG TPA: pyridoxamine 5'-phosphate oxidase family protein, partial [Candidatus Sulfopaludibacter sp.]|nr:pyridoxamine 5'-phosphate oxidase family protein [Candidatus Sulfopaludibacter sp.]
MAYEIQDPICSESDLEAMHAAPASLSMRKVTPRLTPAYRAMVEAAPFAVIATVGPRGLDVSPRGDAAGF